MLPLQAMMARRTVLQLQSRAELGEPIPVGSHFHRCVWCDERYACQLPGCHGHLEFGDEHRNELGLHQCKGPLALVLLRNEFWLAPEPAPIFREPPAPPACYPTTFHSGPPPAGASATFFIDDPLPEPGNLQVTPSSPAKGRQG